MDIASLETWVNALVVDIIKRLSSPDFYGQAGMAVLALSVAFGISLVLKRYFPILRQEPVSGRLLPVKKLVFQFSDLLFPLFSILALGIAADLSLVAVDRDWLIRIAQSVAVIVMLYSMISRFITNPVVSTIFKWILIPIATLHVFGLLNDVSDYLSTLSFQVGNVSISLNGIIRVIVFGSVLFWLGRFSNNIGQQIIRSQEAFDVGTRELVAKLFEVALFLIIFILLLQVMGINLTALAVFGGALGVGLGFGLQSIASNFISGIILLLDRSLTVGDFIELEDGRTGIIREMSMRSTTLETFDGKDIMVPNEQFITTSFVNWTHKDPKQRYSLNFQVAYKTDLDRLFDVVREVVASHPKVLSGPDLPIEERPDAEIAGFGDSGIDILVEFWMEGIDDGKNRVGADLLHMIWDALQENGIEIPFPQREVRILNPQQERP